MASSAGVTYDGGEIKPWTDKRSREYYENSADLFAIIKTVEKLEKAWVRDLISAKEYESACVKLIGQFKTVKTTLEGHVDNIEKFMTDYKMVCPAAKNRLILSGLPATVEHGAPKSQDETNAAKKVAETVQHFITAMDSLKLNMRAVDEVFPLLNDVMSSLNSVSSLPEDFEGKVKTKEWLRQLNSMNASYELNDQQVRQLLFDLESSYTAFHAFLSHQ